jgi:hypothetical protein
MLGWENTADGSSGETAASRGSSSSSTSTSFIFLVLIVVVIIAVTMNSSGGPFAAAAEQQTTQSSSTADKRDQTNSPASFVRWALGGDNDDGGGKNPLETNDIGGGGGAARTGASVSTADTSKLIVPQRPPVPSKPESAGKTKPTQPAKPAEEQLPLAPAPTPPPKPTLREVKLTSHFVALRKLSVGYAVQMHNTLSKIPAGQRTDEEQMFYVVLPFLSNGLVNRRLTDPNSPEFASIVQRLTLHGQWGLLSYLLTCIGGFEHLVRKACKVIRQTVSMAPDPIHNWTATKLDLLFGSLMLSNSVDFILQQDDCFVGDYFHLDPDTFEPPPVKSIIQAILLDYWNMVQLEMQNVLHHSRTELDITMFTRYWQFVQIFKKHRDILPVQARHAALFFYRHHLEQCMFVVNRHSMYQYELIAVQTMAHIINNYPVILLDEFGNLGTAADRFTALAFSLHTNREVREAFLPFMIDFEEWISWDDMSPIAAFEARKEVVLKPDRNTLYYSRDGFMLNKMSKQIIAMNRNYTRHVVMNRSFAPLPTMADPMDRVSGRIYLGSGIATAVPYFNNVDKYFFLKHDRESLPQIQSRRHEIVSFVHSRFAFEGYNELAGSVPKLRLKGIVALDTLTGRYVTNLMLQTIQMPLKDTLTDYRGYLASLLLRFLRQDSIGPQSLRFFQLGRDPVNETWHALARRLLEVGMNVYVNAINRLKEGTRQQVMVEQAKRQRFRLGVKNGKKPRPPPKKQQQPDKDQVLVHAAAGSWYEELIDFDSTELKDDRPVSVYEEKLWTTELDLENDVLSKAFTRYMQPISLGRVVRNRLASLLLLTFPALEYHDAMEPFVKLHDYYRNLHRDLKMGAFRHTDLIKSNSALPDQKLLADRTCTLPFCAVVYSSDLTDGVSLSLQISAPSATPKKKQKSADDNSQSDDGSDEDGDSERVALERKRKRIEQMRLLASPEVTVERNGVQIWRQVLKPMAVPPYALNCMDMRDLSKAYNVQPEESMLDLKTIPLFRDGDTTKDEVNIFVWTNQAAAGSDQPLEQRSNMLTLRVINDKIGEFKLFNVLWDRVQYMLVRQSNRVECGVPAGEPITGISSLWYTVCTSERDEKTKGEKRLTLVDGQGKYFHAIPIAQKEYDELKKTKRVRAPALSLVPNTSSNTVLQLNNTKIYRRIGWERRIQPDLQILPQNV